MLFGICNVHQMMESRRKRGGGGGSGRGEVSGGYGGKILIAWTWSMRMIAKNKRLSKGGKEDGLLSGKIAGEIERQLSRRRDGKKKKKGIDR